MKIVHVTHHYIDGWGYQDNLLPKYQQKAGHEVVVLTDNSHLPSSCKKEIIQKGDEYFDGDIKISKFKTYLNTESSGFICSGLYKKLRSEQPDLIFHHGIDSSSLVVCSVYKQNHEGCRLFVDSHVDEINQTKNKIWLILNNRLLLPSVVKILLSQIDFFWGVTPLRCDYLKSVFKVPVDKIGLLPFGGDSEIIDKIPDDIVQLRKKYNVPVPSFVFVTGGKMDASKGTIVLINAFKKLRQLHKNVHLILFGKADSNVSSLANNTEGVTIKGWCNRLDTLSLIKLSDVAVWPWLHTTLIDDAVSVGTPLIVKHSGNVSHYEETNNGIYLETGDEQEVFDSVVRIMEKPYYGELKNNALEVADKYRYEKIVRIIDDKFTHLSL